MSSLIVATAFGSAAKYPAACRGVIYKKGWFFDSFSASGLIACHPAVEKPGQRCADNGRGPEQPELLQGPAADEDRLAGAARRIDRCIGHRNANQMDQSQTQANGDRGEA